MARGNLSGIALRGLHRTDRGVENGDGHIVALQGLGDAQPDDAAADDEYAVVCVCRHDDHATVRAMPKGMKEEFES